MSGVEMAGVAVDTACGKDIAGGATHDVHILACAQRAGATRLATFNRRDFERFDLGGVTLVVPGA